MFLLDLLGDQERSLGQMEYLLMLLRVMKEILSQASDALILWPIRADMPVSSTFLGLKPKDMPRTLHCICHVHCRASPYLHIRMCEGMRMHTCLKLIFSAWQIPNMLPRPTS